MDHVLCDFDLSYNKLKNEYVPHPQTAYGFFTNLKPMSGAIETYNWLSEHFDVWILTRPSYQNPLCYTEKRVWVENHFGLEMCKKLIICPDKSLLKGDFLIDDNSHDFEGTEIKFGTDEYPNWEAVKNYFEQLIKLYNHGNS